jgi:hypothetical protein
MLLHSNWKTDSGPKNGKHSLEYMNCHIFKGFVRYLLCCDSASGTDTRYGLHGPWIEPWWGARFSKPVHIGHGSHLASYGGAPGPLPGSKEATAWRVIFTRPPPISRRGKRKCKAISLLPFWAFMACSRMKFTFSIFHVWFCTAFCSRDQHILSILNIQCYTKLLTPTNKACAFIYSV